MIHRSTNKSGRGLATLTVPTPCDSNGEIRNGYPVKPYLPKDPERRARLLEILGLKEDA